MTKEYINLQEMRGELANNPDDFVDKWVELTVVLNYEFDPEQRRNCYWLEFKILSADHGFDTLREKSYGGHLTLGLDIDWNKTLTSQVLDEENEYNKFGPTIPREKAWRDKVPIWMSKGKEVYVRGILRGPDENKESSFYYIEPEAIETQCLPLGGWNIIRFKVKQKEKSH